MKRDIGTDSKLMKNVLLLFFKVQPHLKKCFDNIKSLKMAKVTRSSVLICLRLHGCSIARFSLDASQPCVRLYLEFTSGCPHKVYTLK